jgi:hypothetical protein
MIKTLVNQNISKNQDKAKKYKKKSSKKNKKHDDQKSNVMVISGSTGTNISNKNVNNYDSKNTSDPNKAQNKKTMMVPKIIR